MATEQSQSNASVVVGGLVMVVAIAGAVVLSALGKDSAALLASIVPTVGVLFNAYQQRQTNAKVDAVARQTNGVLSELVARVPDPNSTLAVQEGHVEPVAGAPMPVPAGRHSE